MLVFAIVVAGFESVVVIVILLFVSTLVDDCDANWFGFFSCCCPCSDEHRLDFYGNDYIEDDDDSCGGGYVDGHDDDDDKDDEDILLLLRSHDIGILSNLESGGLNKFHCLCQVIFSAI